MRRYYYENRLAKVLLMFSTCHTIAIAWFVLSKLKEKDTDQVDRNHETIHAMQWTEVTMAVGTIMFSLVLLLGISAWWLLVSPFAYYISHITVSTNDSYYILFLSFCQLLYSYRQYKKETQYSGFRIPGH